MRVWLAGALAALTLALALASPAWAQTSNQVIPGFLTTSGCPSTATMPCFVPYSSSNPLPVTGSSGSGGNGFTAANTYTPISATTGGASTTISTGSPSVVVATNVGTTNGAYCALGASASTSSQYIAPNGGWFAFQVGAATQLTCVTSTSTTTVNVQGGSGLATGTGGGGGSSGGAITAPLGQIAPSLSVATTENSTPITGQTLSGSGGVGIQGWLSQIHIDVTQPIATQAPSVPIGGVSADPCNYAAKSNFAIATSSGNLQLVAGSGTTKIYVCAAHIIGATAWVFNLIEGTGAACTTASEFAVEGSTTAASGESYAANGGYTEGAGIGTIARTTTAGNGLCLLQSGTAALAGNITYVQQ